EMSNAQGVPVTPSSAAIAWAPNLPAQAQAAFGLDQPTVWSQPSAESLVQHQSDLTGLEFRAPYQVSLHAVDEWNRAQTTTVSVTTQPMPNRSVASTNGAQIVVDNHPFFATAVWAQCSDGFNSNINDGINLFMGDGCKDDTTLPTRLGDARCRAATAAKLPRPCRRVSAAARTRSSTPRTPMRRDAV